MLCSVVAIDLGLGGQYRWSETLWESRGWSGWLPPPFSVGGSNSEAVDTCSALQTVTISSWSWWSWWSQCGSDGLEVQIDQEVGNVMTEQSNARVRDT